MKLVALLLVLGVITIGLVGKWITYNNSIIHKITNDKMHDVFYVQILRLALMELFV